MIMFDNKLLRLTELKKRRPQYAEIYDFYTGLCQFLQEENTSWLDCRPEIENWEQRRKAGFPLLNRGVLFIDEGEAARFVGALLDILIKLGKQGEAELVLFKQALDAKNLSLEKLLTACLEKERAPLIEAADKLKIPSTLLEYACSTALAFGLQHWRETTLQPSFVGWQEGYCPICGGIPSMGELVGEEGQKRLHCSVCAVGWDVTRLKCSYCGNEETDSLEYFTAEGEAGYRVDVCRKCSCYLKVVDSRELGEGLPMDVEDLNSMHLDLLAQKEGFAKGKIDQK